MLSFNPPIKEEKNYNDLKIVEIEPTIKINLRSNKREFSTKIGKILRKTSLDELPQLWNVLKGNMSLVGPRPALFSQEKLRDARKRHDVYRVRPGITGLSQVSGLDTSTPELLAETDAKMIENLSLIDYFKYIIATAGGKGGGDAAQR